jgi:hypothetical protein
MSGQQFVYDSERQRRERFVGRAKLLAQLDRLLVDRGADRCVVVTGGPGMGRSAILATWLARRETAGRGPARELAGSELMRAPRPTASTRSLHSTRGRQSTNARAYRILLERLACPALSC